jgi:hypothetical protein
MIWGGSGRWICRSCRAAYQRNWRKSHPEPYSEKIKARAVAKVYLARGKIQRQPCCECGQHRAQMHHEDYSRPLDVMWLCRRCHMKHHYPNAERNQTRPKRRYRKAADLGVEVGMCACGRGPKRPNQRNCRECHALAQRIYRSRQKNAVQQHCTNEGRHGKAKA